MSASDSNTSEPRRRARRHLASAGVQVLHEDNHLLVVAKPAGLASQGGTDIDDHLVERIDAYRREAEAKPGRAYVGLVHRLDRNVSGVLVLAKTSKAAGRLAALFRERAEGLRKIYLAWVDGRVEGEDGALTHRLVRHDRRTREASSSDEDARDAHLSWRVDGRGSDTTRLEVELHTGIAHQIRAQLSLAGHPIVGDTKYGGPQGARPALHALRLVFPHPVGGETVDVTAPVPADLERLDRRLGLAPPVRA
jgi:23S rRNA pseudouridine1911/1915/1917 synthase